MNITKSILLWMILLSLLIFPSCSEPDVSAGADASSSTSTTVPTIETTASPTTEATAPPAAESTTPPTESNRQDYILNNNTMRFHFPSCGSAAKINEENKASFHGTREELLAKGYSPCGNCHP